MVMMCCPLLAVREVSPARRCSVFRPSQFQATQGCIPLYVRVVVRAIADGRGTFRQCWAGDATGRLASVSQLYSELGLGSGAIAWLQVWCSLGSFIPISGDLPHLSPAPAPC